MPVRNCPNCNKIFLKKSHYDKHVNISRKNPCLPQYTQISPKIHQNAPNCTKNSPKNNNIEISSDAIDINIKNSNKCIYCGKIFTRDSSLNRHISDRCKIKKQQENNKVILLEKELCEIKYKIK